MSAVATAAPISIEPRKADRLYALPAPTTTGERSRLNTQHRALFLTHGSLYSAPEHVERMLAPGQAHTPIIADVGCGSGAWSLDMAQIFPHAEVIGMDINPPSVDADTPPNCKFVTHDANDDFTEYKNMFSVVHMRAIDAGVRDYKQLLDKVAQTLIPGGVLLLSSGQLVLYSENKTPMPFVEEGQEGWTAVQTILGHQERCLRLVVSHAR
ncbi:hypothetical protein FRB99_006537 [Tulasnella sp. 403]|nr:hypothetical protein FRB99_006537 [Tulasnella sp. 403]